MHKFITILMTLVLAVALCSCSAGDELQETSADDLAGTPTSQSIEGPDSTPVKTPIATTQPFESQTPPPTQEVQTSTPQTERPVGVVRNSGEIIGTGVAFREGPSVDSGLIERLDHGTFVQILKTNVDAQWHQVKYNGKAGYINRMYVTLDASLDGYKLDFVGTVINCQNDVNVRSEPSTDSEIIGVANKGSDLTILPQDIYIEDWYQVEYNGEVAYIHADYLDVSAIVEDDQLSDLTINGGSIYPAFSPNEYGYVVKASASSVTIKAKANDGVDIDIGGSGKSSYTIEIPAAGMRTVRIALDGKILYSVYISGDVVTVGTWNH